MNDISIIDKNRDSIYPCLGSFFAESITEGGINTEILETYKMREAEPSRFITVTIGTASVSSASTFLISPINTGQEISALHSEMWNPVAWRLRVGRECVSNVEIQDNPTQPSVQKEISIAELIAKIRTNHDIRFGNQLAARLEYLIDISREEFPHQEPISPQSLRDFISFINSFPDIIFPALVLTPQGNIRAEWTIARNKHFAVEYLGNSDTSYVIFAPDKKKPYKTNRSSGLSTIDNLEDIIKLYGVFNWFKTTVKLPT